MDTMGSLRFQRYNLNEWPFQSDPVVHGHVPPWGLATGELSNIGGSWHSYCGVAVP